MGKVAGQIYWYEDVANTHPSLSNVLEVGAAENANIISYEVIPEGEESGRHGHAEEGAVHDNLNKKGEGNGYEDGHEDPFEDLFDHAQVENHSEVDFVFDGGDDVIDPEDNELQIRYNTDYDEDQHIYVPLEPEIQKNFSVVQRGEDYLELILEVHTWGGV